VFAKIFEALYLKVFVNIIVKAESTVVYIELYSKKGTVDNTQMEFSTKVLDEKMYEFITKYTKESPYFYISLLDYSSLQGAIPTCTKNRLSYYYDLSNCEYKCYDDKWVYFTSKTELYEIEKRYQKIGVDFIFSPFVLLANFFRDKINSKIAIYVLIQEEFVSVAIFENSQLLFAEHLNMQTDEDIDDIMLANDIEDENLELLDGGIDLEHIDVDDAGSDLDDFGDIEDLDSLEEIDEFDDSKDVEEELLESDSTLHESDEESFNEDYQRFSLIQHSIARFYKDEKYESQFLENIYIADGIGVSSDLKKYLEEEMFFHVYIRHSEIDTELCEVTKEELGL